MWLLEAGQGSRPAKDHRATAVSGAPNAMCHACPIGTLEATSAPTRPPSLGQIHVRVGSFASAAGHLSESVLLLIAALPASAAYRREGPKAAQ